MRAPKFWFRPADAPGFAARALSPLGHLYATATAARLRKSGLRLPVPVICVGNLNVGGTGKTPTVIALLQMLADRGAAPHVVSRGYGGTLKGPHLVDPRRDTAADVGDEPLIVANFAPVHVSRDRAAAAKAAVEGGADVIVMDDGFQNPALRKDLSILVVDAETGFGNGRVVPAGPLREGVSAGMGRADLLLSIGSANAQQGFDAAWGAQIPCARATGRLSPIRTGMPWDGLRVLAFAGIGRPQKFFDTLNGVGANVVAARSFDDHQVYSDTILARLTREAREANAQLVTTEKDAVRLPASFRPSVLTVPVRLEFDDPAPVLAALDRIGI
ncbi:tetraacyldisaccharide 4'-kinase [Palleronia abyssalis]|uniref:Tetraacyldisaccharide 4'-kinase n=1 Tax=Palleronia abyssalis TaxID=1501240 RepID=A0A2R8BTG5_9RHOB|nr:tetraacyldisaccharide 4'-kinase [Palleronia abyssalis]SPJ23469.1 Tetraacyldisaccharide 4'-kinase [Palleronia abyssalis]